MNFYVSTLESATQGTRGRIVEAKVLKGVLGTTYDTV